MKAVLDNSRVSTHLGQTSKYKDQYDPKLLVREPRSSNREQLDIKDDNLPFVGYDIWNAYEVSGVTFNGMPVSGVAKIIYSCDSSYIVESKSIKLYFNSFNMYKCGVNAQKSLAFIKTRATEDLSELLETDVQVQIWPSHEQGGLYEQMFDHSLYTTLETMKYTDSTQFDTYVETPELLETVDEHIDIMNRPHRRYYHSSLLKSNCRVTSQPDWGDVYIYIKSHEMVDWESLLKYIVSFRDECHFHEEICETIYKRLSDVYAPLELCVTCLYTRRGGIDINPTRASSEALINDWLTEINLPHVKTNKQ